ncbi:MAG TPA: hypothetical protein VJT73_14170 [Polyangiaceae bacterium]|nr:hypothetical protein [Polyangiaceae bacterium]
MLDSIRATLRQALETPRGDAVAVVRVPKLLARRFNLLLGSPLCSVEESHARRAARAKLARLAGVAAAPAVREAAPVVVYFEKDRNQRLIERVEELLRSRGIAFRSLDVTGDEATLAFIMREAKCEEDDLPVVYVAGTPIGGYNELVEWDVSGKLKSAVG